MILSFNSKEKIVGAFIIMVFILLMSTVVLIGRGKDWFKKNIIYYASFSESYDLNSSAPVKLFNADIGKVKKIVLKGDRVIVTLAIYKEYAPRIKVDTTATVDGISYIGKKYISIKPGGEGSTPLLPGGNIKTVESRSISEILSEFEIEKTARMAVQSIQELAELIQILKDPQGPLFTATTRINKSLYEIESRVGIIMQNAVEATSKVPGAVDQAKVDLVKIQKISDQVLENIAVVKKILANLEEGSVEVPPVTRSIKIRLQEASALMDDAADVTKALKKNILIRSNIPPALKGDGLDSGLR